MCAVITMAVRTQSPLAFQILYMPRNRYICNYMIWWVVLLPLFFPACKFLQLPVQVLVGFLTRPVTADHTHYDSGQCEEKHYENDGLHMIKVPCIRPSIRAIAIAEMNMPAMIHARSISTIPTARS